MGSGRRGFSFPFPGFTGSFNGDENCRRIGEVLVRNKGRNPLLVGVCAYETLASFSEFISENFDKGYADLRFAEVGRFAEQNLGPGLVVNLGDLKAFVGGEGGATASYEGYLKFVSRFPSIEKDWDLQLLPITSFRNSMVESYPKSSLMESFVPFGGFFSTPSELNSSLSSSNPCISRCHMCNERCEQEVLAVSKGGFIASVADQYQSNLSSWLKMTELGTNKGLDGKACKKNGIAYASVLITPNHLGQTFILLEDFKKAIRFPLSVVSELNTKSAQSKQWAKPSKEDLESGGLRSPCCFSNSSMADGSQASPASVTSVTTDLGLRISPVSTSNEPKKSVNKNHRELPQELSGSLSPNVDVVNGSISEQLAQSSPSSSLDFGGQFDPSSFKTLFGALREKVSWQDEAVHVISQTIAHCRTANKDAKERV
ncbi:hypothetical protein GH714_036924 [Hevea brasiliensis]|uniref:Uncharacterized protein n=1 Tax=Hevea brasiliensis TaxID=3981 RepID=A0A6A6L844_HEVBR|nr:hypothetical protein GH714_036924 [Hevea brasiliensis]